MLANHEDRIVEPTVHPTGQQQVTVATFTGTHEYVPFDLRPWPERVAEHLRRLDAEVRRLEDEIASLKACQQWYRQAAP